MLIEDDPGDADLIEEILSEVKGVSIDLEFADRLQIGLDRLAKGGIDVVLLDLSLPDSHGFDTFIKAHAHASQTPIIVMTGLDDETVAVRSVREGAQDYLVKGELDSNLLVRSIRYAIERKRAGEVLKKANEELKKLNEMKSNFVSTVSHELRTSLTSIKNAVDILASGKAGAFNEAQGRFLAMAVRNIDRLGKLINDVLDLSKMEAGKVAFQFSEVDLSSVIQNVITTFQPQAEANSLKLAMDFSTDLPAVNADPGKIKRVLCNLLSTAMKFTPEGGHIVVAAGKTTRMSR